MKNAIPASWRYSPELENLFFFFQASEELLSYSSPDCFRLPVCNSITLCREIRYIYRFLYRSKQIERYYSKYIPCIIDELIKAIRDDDILKEALGLRFDNTVTGLVTAKTHPQELLEWTSVILQSCTLEQHIEACKTGIVKNVLSGNNKTQLLWYIQNYYIDLIAFGYSTEYLYQANIRYFDNRDTQIDAPNAICAFLDRFNRKDQEHEFYVIADTYKLDSIAKINPQYGKNLCIQELDEAAIVTLKRNNGNLRRFHDTFLDLTKGGNPSFKMLSCKAIGLDPYSAFDDIAHAFDLAQCLEGYFKHKSENRIFFDILLVRDTSYTPIKLRRVIPNRPHVDQTIINHRIDTLLSADCCPVDVVVSLLRAMDMHLDALNCKNAETMLRTFWTALEALAFTSNETDKKENAKYCLLHIIQKTYILKQFRLIYEQMLLATTDKFWQQMGINNFNQFVASFMAVSADDPGFRNFTTPLSTNPLLRTRIYRFRKSLSSPQKVQEKIEDHREKVSWQIDRIYRTRNLSTHAGVSMPYVNEILFNIHNYFDYVVNYIICKLECRHFIHSVSDMVFEAKLDNQIHIEFLKKQQEITDENYLNVLLGPDINIISFNFEVALSEDHVPVQGDISE